MVLRNSIYLQGVLSSVERVEDTHRSGPVRRWRRCDAMIVISPTVLRQWGGGNYACAFDLARTLGAAQCKGRDGTVSVSCQLVDWRWRRCIRLTRDQVTSVCLWWRLSIWHGLNLPEYNHHFDSQHTSRRSLSIPLKTTERLQHIKGFLSSVSFNQIRVVELQWCFVFDRFLYALKSFVGT